MPNTPGKQSRKLPRQRSGGNPLLLGSKMANVVLGCCEAVMNLRIFVSQGDSTSSKSAIEADVKYTDGNLVAIIPLSSTPADTNSGGWHWATPRVYDAARTKIYTKDEIIYLPKTDALVTGELAPAGVWVCLQTANSAISGQRPAYPYPVDDNPDNSSNYWLFLSTADWTCV